MNKHIKEVCKIGQGKECCRYLVMGARGFECVKYSEMATVLDLRVETDTIVAQGDNCEGKTVPELNQENE